MTGTISHSILWKRAPILTFTLVLHAVFLMLVIVSNGTFISNRDLAPRIIFGLWLFLSVYVISKLLRLVFKLPALTPGAIHLVTKNAGLVPAILLVLFGGILLLATLGGSNNPIDPPILGNSPRIDETVVVLSSYLAFSSFFLSLTSKQADRGEPDTTREASTSSETAPRLIHLSPERSANERETVIGQLASRAAQLQERSRYLLVGIVVMVICAAVFIVFAGQITSLDVSGNKLVALALADVRSAEDELTRIVTEINRTHQMRLQRTTNKADQRLDVSTPEDDRLIDETSLLKLEAKKAALSKANEVLLRVKDKQFDDGRSKDQASNQLLLIQTSVTRFGVVLIVVFLVQILVNLYRYNMRLAAFYSSRCDSLLLSKQVVGLRDLVDIMSPHNLDFGRPPKTPAEEIKSMLEAWAGNLRGHTKANDDIDSNGKGRRSTRSKAL